MTCDHPLDCMSSAGTAASQGTAPAVAASTCAAATTTLPLTPPPSSRLSASGGAVGSPLRARATMAHQAGRSSGVSLSSTRISVLTGPVVKHNDSADIQVNWHPTRRMLASFTSSAWHQVTVACVILFNMYLVARDTDQRAMGVDPDAWMKYCAHCCLFVYVIDLAAKIYVHRDQCLYNPMDWFDFFIVGVDIVLLLLASTVGEVPSTSVLRGLRMLRIVRVFLEFLIFRELYLMFQGLLSAMRSIVFGSLVIFMLLTMWSVLAVELVHPINQRLDEQGVYGNCERCGRSFESVMTSNLTFLMNVVCGDSWGRLSVPIMEKAPWTALIVMGCFITVNLGLLNVIAAVIVDRQSQARLDDEELVQMIHQEQLQQSYSNLRRLFANMDADGSGVLSRDELLESYHTQGSFKELLDLMDVNYSDMETVFDILDADSSGDVSYEEFVRQLHYMKTMDSHTLLIFIRHSVNRVLNHVCEFDSTARRRADKERKVFNDLSELVARTAHSVERLASVSKSPLGPFVSTAWDKDMPTSEASPLQGNPPVTMPSSGKPPTLQANGCTADVRRCEVVIRSELQELRCRLEQDLDAAAASAAQMLATLGLSLPGSSLSGEVSRTEQRPVVGSSRDVHLARKSAVDGVGANDYEAFPDAVPKTNSRLLCSHSAPSITDAANTQLWPPPELLVTPELPLRPAVPQQFALPLGTSQTTSNKFSCPRVSDAGCGFVSGRCRPSMEVS